MALIKELGDSFKKKLEDGVKSAQEGISKVNVNEVVQGAKEAATNTASTLGETLGTKAKEAMDDISNIDIGEAVQGAKNAASDGMATITSKIESAIKEAPEESEEPSFKEFITLLWCLAFADGEISEEERSMLADLSGSLDENFNSYSAELEEQYAEKIQVSGKEFGHLNAVKIEAQRIIESLEITPTDAKLLCWNLLALANSDGLDESELDLIRFISEKTGMETAAFEELRNYSDAIIEIDNSIEQLKQSDKSYGEIEPLVSEFEKRKLTIIESAQALITDR